MRKTRRTARKAKVTKPIRRSNKAVPEMEYISKGRKRLNKKQLRLLAKQPLPISDKASQKPIKDKKGNIIIETNAKPKIFTQMRIDIEFSKQKGNRMKKIRVIGKSQYHMTYDKEKMFKEAFFQAFAQCTFSPQKWVLYGIYHRIKAF